MFPGSNPLTFFFVCAGLKLVAFSMSGIVLTFLPLLGANGLKKNCWVINHKTRFVLFGGNEIYMKSSLSKYAWSAVFINQ